jgi:hypothetical protein
MDYKPSYFTPPHTSFDDLNHAAMTVDAMAQTWRAQIGVFYDTEMRRMTNLYSKGEHTGFVVCCSSHRVFCFHAVLVFNATTYRARTDGSGGLVDASTLVSEIFLSFAWLSY